MIAILFRGIKGELTTTDKTLKGNDEFPYVYGLRHSYSDWDWPATIEPVACVNSWGVVRLSTPMPHDYRGSFTLTFSESEYLLRKAEYEALRA